MLNEGQFSHLLWLYHYVAILDLAHATQFFQAIYGKVFWKGWSNAGKETEHKELKWICLSLRRKSDLDPGLPTPT